MGTLVLCEILLSFLPLDNTLDQPYRLLKEYDVMPLGTLELNWRIDLYPYAKVRNGPGSTHPSAKKIWVLVGKISHNIW